MTAITNKLARFRNDESGASLLEVTVLVPVLLTIGLGIFEFGNVMFQRHLVQAGLRDAGRYLAGLPQANATHMGNAKEIALTGEIDGTVYRVDWWQPGKPGYSFPDPTYTANTSTFTLGGNPITLRASPPVIINIQTSVQYQSLGYLTGWLGLGNLTINASHEERWIGNR